MLGHKYSNMINPNIRPIDEVLKDKNISKEARDLLLQNEIKRKLSQLELKESFDKTFDKKFGDPLNPPQK